MRTIKTKTIFLLLYFASTIPEIAAQDDASTPSGKPLILVFTNLNTSFNREGNNREFEITRAYLGYEHKFSKAFSSRVILDVGDPGAGGLQLTAFVKNAFLAYETNNFNARIGMIGTDQFSVQEKHWGYRYIYKSFQDQHSFGPSADLGAGIEYSPSKFISIDASLLNGEGYKRIQNDSVFKATAGITITPVEGFVLRAYYDYMNRDAAQSTVSLFTGYTLNDLRIGVEYSMQRNNRMISGDDFSGISAWIAYNFAEKFSVFTRYENLWSETLAGETQPWNQGNDGELFLAGLDYSPVKGVKIAPVWMGWLPADRNEYFTSQVGLHFEIRY